MSDDAADAVLATRTARLTEFLLERVPEYTEMLDQLDSWIATHMSYIVAINFYDFTVNAWKDGREDVVRRAVQCADEALGEPEDIEMPLAIDFFEPLADDIGAPHYQSLVEGLGAQGRRRLDEILTGDSSES